MFARQMYVNEFRGALCVMLNTQIISLSSIRIGLANGATKPFSDDYPSVTPKKYPSKYDGRDFMELGMLARLDNEYRRLLDNWEHPPMARIIGLHTNVSPETGGEGDLMLLQMTEEEFLK